MAPSLSPYPSSTFLGLPLEIRDQIYRLCVPQNLVFNYSWNRSGASREKGFCVEEPASEYFYGTLGPKAALPALLLVCCQITEEVERMLYGRNTFKIQIDNQAQSNFAQLLSTERRSKMKKIIMVFEAAEMLSRPDFTMNPTIWDGVLGNVTMLGIVAKQPEHRKNGSPEGAKDIFEDWAARLRPKLDYLSRALSGSAQVIVDADNMEDTIRIFQGFREVMSTHCVFKPLVTADCIFGRGKFSSEHGQTSFEWVLWDYPSSSSSASSDYYI